MERADNVDVKCCDGAPKIDGQVVDNRAKDAEYKIVPRCWRRKEVPSLETLRNCEAITFTTANLKPFFILPLHQAAKKLGICATALKKVCRKVGIMNWPFRKIKTLDKKLAVIASSQSTPSADDDETKDSKALILSIMNRRELLLQGIDVNISDLECGSKETNETSVPKTSDKKSISGREAATASDNAALFRAFGQLQNSESSTSRRGWRGIDPKGTCQSTSVLSKASAWWQDSAGSSDDSAESKAATPLRNTGSCDLNEILQDDRRTAGWGGWGGQHVPLMWISPQSSSNIQIHQDRPEPMRGIQRERPQLPLDVATQSRIDDHISKADMLIEAAFSAEQATRQGLGGLTAWTVSSAATVDPFHDDWRFW